MPAIKSRAWCFTLFTNVNVNNNYEYDMDPVENLVYQFERSPDTDRLHVQGYVYFKNARGMNGVKKWLNDNSAHLEIAKGSKQDNFKYCTKLESRADPDMDPYVFGEFEDQQGKRTDLVECVDFIKQKRKWSEIVEAFPTVVAKYARNLKEIYVVTNNVQAQRDGDWSSWHKAVWIHGPSDIGKTSYVFKRYPKGAVFFKSPLTKWFDGFDPLVHEAIVIEDYPRFESKEIDYNFLLRLCQPFPVQVETKGGMVALGRQKIFFTSNWTPQEIFYNKIQEENDPLMRRLFVKTIPLKAIKQEDPPAPQDLPVQAIPSEVDLTNSDEEVADILARLPPINQQTVPVNPEDSDATQDE